VGVTALLVIRLILSLHAISRPGLQQDETLFVNAATLRLPGIFLQSSFHGIPLMVFPYIGALKSWLTDPIFALFGTDPTTIRLPAVLLATASLALIYPAVRDLVNRPVAISAFCVLCFDNSVFWLTRDDVGPSAIEFLLKCVALMCAARFARRQTYTWLVLLLVTLALGVFNKLNFIWVVNAATVISVIIIMCHRRVAHARLPIVTVWFVGLALIYGAFGWYYISHHINSILGGPAGGALIQPWIDFKQGMMLVLSGTWFYAYALAPLAPRAAVVWITLILFSIGTLASVLPGRSRSMPVAMIALAALLTAVQILFTLQATAGWHYVAVYPFVTIVAVYGAYVLASTAFKRKRDALVALAVATVFAIGYSGALMGKYIAGLNREPINPAWSPAIYTLSSDLQHLKGHIFTADWGLFEPLFALHPGTRYVELAFALESPDPAALPAIGQSVAAVPGQKLVVTRVPSQVVFPEADRNLFKAAHGHLRLILTVPGLDGKPLYQVYTYQ
jgi:4-amino-4-deoxy-L-arabinose transferase-like glycosyltransferase